MTQYSFEVNDYQLMLVHPSSSSWNFSNSMFNPCSLAISPPKLLLLATGFNCTMIKSSRHVNFNWYPKCYSFLKKIRMEPTHTQKMKHIYYIWIKSERLYVYIDQLFSNLLLQQKRPIGFLESTLCLVWQLIENGNMCRKMIEARTQ